MSPRGKRPSERGERRYVRSDEFTMGDKLESRYVVVAPRGLWRRVQAKARGVISIRALVLGLLKRWVEGDIQHPVCATCGDEHGPTSQCPVAIGERES